MFLKLAVPKFICIREKKRDKGVDRVVKDLDFVYDGVTITSPQFLECIDDSDDFSFPRYRQGKIKSIASHQYVHRSGALFIRKMKDRYGKVILVGIENYRHASGENQFREITRNIVKELSNLVQNLEEDDD